MPSLISTACVHCGQPAEPPRAGELAFCCAGCRTVYEILQDNGLGAFYGLRERDDATPVVARERTNLDTLSKRYAHFDDPAFLAEQGAHRGEGDAEAELDLRVAGMHCAACVWILERLPQACPGVTSARVDFGANRLRLRWDRTRIRLAEVAAFAHRLGYPLSPGSRDAEDAERELRRRDVLRIAIAGALAGNVMMAAFALYAGELATMDASFVRLFEWIAFGLSIPAVGWAALPFYRGAWAGLRMGLLHMDLPISLGIGAGFLASAWGTLTGAPTQYYDSITILVFLLLLGRYAQRWGQRRVATGNELLLSLTPATALRTDGGRCTPVYVGQLSPGERVRVEAGQRFAVDGWVRQGRGHVDLSMLTGESRPIAIGPGSRVFAGAVNLDAEVDVEVEHVGRATRIGAILERLATDTARKPAIVRLADRISGWFVAVVVGLAVVGGLAWATIDTARAFDVVVSLLVISCPCALGLATPMALTVARARAARRGIILRSASALEILAEVPTFVLDKTGTLTEGQLTVLQARLSAEPDVCLAVRGLERRASHPIARALELWCEPRLAATSDGIDEPIEFVERAGLGLEGVMKGHRYRVGSTSWLGAGRFVDEIDAALEAGHSVVVVERDADVLGFFALGDRIRADAPEFVAHLRALGRRVAVCSGDHPKVVASVARSLGIDEARGGASPEDKAEWVAGLHPCAMVGDGINDALALRRAAVGVAVSGGAEGALEVADVYTSNGGLAALVELVGGSRRTMSLIRRNLGFSLVYNVIFAGLALAGFITPLVAAIIMPLSSLTVVGSSVLARTFGHGSANARSNAPLAARSAKLAAIEQCS